MFILDTDHLTIIQRKGSAEHARLIERMRLYPLEKFFVTIVSFHEQVNGWNAYVQRSRNDDGVIRGYAMFESLLSDYAKMNVLPFNADSAKAFAQLRRSRVRVGTMDLRIGSIALERGFTVLTRNVVDFDRIPGLHVEDWTAAIRGR